MSCREQKIAIIGAGGWGTALSLLLAKKGHMISLWVWDADQARIMLESRENPMLPGFPLPQTISITTSIEEAVEDSTAVLFVVVSRGAEEAVKKLCRCIPDGIPVLSATKGLYGKTGQTVSQMLKAILPPSNQIAALSGPNLAAEVVRGIPTATVVACTDDNIAHQLQELLMSPTLRVYTNTDILGVELAGALKNVIAIGAGISDGLGYGDNTKAALLTRGLAEISRLGIKMGAKQSTFMGLAGIGDLMATCASPLSRNRRIGLGLGHGKTLEQIMQEIGACQIAEGIPTTEAAYNLAMNTNTPMPITEQVYKTLFEGKSPQRAVIDLMCREPKDEVW